MTYHAQTRACPACDSQNGASEKTGFGVKLHILILGLFMTLVACTSTSQSGLSEAGYFPPMGLSNEAVALRERTTTHTRRVSTTQTSTRTRVANVEVPLDEVVFEDTAPVAAPAVPGDGNIQTARTIMASLCLPNAGNLTNLKAATTAINVRLFGAPPPIDTPNYTLGGKRFGAVAPIRFTPGFSRQYRTYGCGVAVRGERPDTVAQALFADMAAAGLTPTLKANSGTGNRIYTVSGGRRDLELLISTRRAAGKPLTNFVLIHK